MGSKNLGIWLVLLNFSLCLYFTFVFNEKAVDLDQWPFCRPGGRRPRGKKL